MYSYVSAIQYMYFHSNLSPFVISRSPSVTISTVLALVMYLLYLFGMIFPNIPKMIINRHVPRPNANIDIFCRLRTAPWLHLVLHLKQGTPCGRRVLLSFQLIERFTIFVIVVFEPLIIHHRPPRNRRFFFCQDVEKSTV